MAQAQPSVTRRAVRLAQEGPAEHPEPAALARADGQAPLSRRDLRVTRAPSATATFAASIGRALASGADRLTGRRGSTTAAGRHSHVSPPTHTGSAPHPTTLRNPASWRWAPMLGVAPAVGLSLTVLMLIGGVGYVHADTLARADQASTVAEQVRRHRADVAAADRLTGVAMAVAAERRAEALDAARTALDAASAVVVVATDMVAAETLSPLDDAVTQLAEMVDQAPDPVSAPDAAPAGQTTAAAAASTPSDPSPAPSVAASGPSDPSAASPSPSPGSPSPSPAAPDGASIPPAASPVVAAAPSDATQVRLEDATLGPVAPPSASETLVALDLGTSARMLEAAAELTELSSQVRAAADAVAAQRAAEQAAAEQAAADAAAAQRAAAEAAAAQLARRVAAAIDSPNGAIPREVLCGVSFDSDVLLRCDAAAALERLNGAYREQFGRDLRVSSSYRDYDGQVEVKTTRGDLAATPGTSNHGRGLAVDLDGFGDVGEFTRPGYLWMKAHSDEFGWLHPPYMDPGGIGPLEPWHWEYDT